MAEPPRPTPPRPTPPQDSWPWPTPEQGSHPTQTLPQPGLDPQQPLGSSGAGPQWPLPDGGGPAPESPSRRSARRQRRVRSPRQGVGRGVVAATAVLALVVGTLLGLVLAPQFGIETVPDAAPAPTSSPPPSSAPSTLVPPAPSTPDEGGAPSGAADISAIAAQALPSTVAIEVRSADAGSSGSGFVLREDGHILTNAHVVAAAVDGGAELTVVFSNGEQAPATVVGVTSDYDLAVIKVDVQGLVPLALGDSDEVRVGETVVAVGAPLGLQGTVTAGIVSALNRPVQAGDAEQTSFINAIQTDAAINPGNSGGPLLDDQGRVIGINSAIAQPPGQNAAGSIGLGFAIPSNQARRTAEQLIANGFATYPVIGVLLDSGYQGVGVKVSDAASNGVEPVTPGGAAEAAGILAGDVIVAIDGVPLTVPDELIVAIRARAPGDTVVLTVRESAGDRDVAVVLGEERSS
ncbi:peptidase S1 [Serinibacter arcticus]|uniref:Peptidase S1 n=1 Tax=Serinibacter arcticus TaxID=1655435 RepID=A0A2U1ZTT0_9MICO|nr:trypsin-like peptidase domain-containing protein [Serinibacter arcticus]PWD50332.1 peptidase S1 [Serinibacter arcticus]